MAAPYHHISVPSHVRDTPEDEKDSLSSLTSASKFPSPYFTSKVGSFLFPPSKEMPTFSELENVLKKYAPWLICPGKHRLYQKSQRFPTPLTGESMHTHKLLYFSCHCGDLDKKSNTCFQVLLRVRIHPIPHTSGNWKTLGNEKGDCIPASQQYEVFP